MIIVSLPDKALCLLLQARRFNACLQRKSQLNACQRIRKFNISDNTATTHQARSESLLLFHAAAMYAHVMH